jgi:hypothetical protein
MTGQKVQGWVADDAFDAEREAFESISCSACGQIHLVNLRSGKVVGADEPQHR